MTEVIPTIIAKDSQELKKKIKLIGSYSSWVQLDVMDGKFVPNKTWQDPEDLKSIKTSLKIEVHLMINDPQRVIKKWLKAAQRIIIHWESRGAKKVRFTKQMGIALNPGTPWQEIEKFIPQIDLVLLMTVHPGFGGQKFLKEVLPKIKSLRKKYPQVKIEVDGGINPKTGKKCVEAGADILVSGNYIFKSRNIKEAIEKLKSI